LSKIKEDHKEELARVSQEIEEESSNRAGMEKRLGDVRREVSPCTFLF